eukprot:s1159_g1.t1
MRKILTSTGFYLNAEELKELQYYNFMYHSALNALAVEAMNNGQLLWKVRPKGHQLDHLVLDAARLMNPVQTSAYSEEDLVGRLKRLALQCHPRRLGLTVLQSRSKPLAAFTALLLRTWASAGNHILEIEAEESGSSAWNQSAQGALSEKAWPLLSERFPVVADFDIADANHFAHEFGLHLASLLGEAEVDTLVAQKLESALHLQQTQVWNLIKGCDAVCPCCGSKCDRVDNHTKHSCRHHLLPAFNGWRVAGTCEAALDACLSSKNHEALPQGPAFVLPARGSQRPYSEGTLLAFVRPVYRIGFRDPCTGTASFAAHERSPLLAAAFVRGTMVASNSPRRASFGEAAARGASCFPFGEQLNCLSVCGISEDATQRELHILFSACPGYVSSSILSDEASKRPYALVQFQDADMALQASAARQGTYWEEGARPITIDLGSPFNLAKSAQLRLHFNAGRKMRSPPGCTLSPPRRPGSACSASSDGSPSSRGREDAGITASSPPSRLDEEQIAATALHMAKERRHPCPGFFHMCSEISHGL